MKMSYHLSFNNYLVLEFKVQQKKMKILVQISNQIVKQ